MERPNATKFCDELKFNRFHWALSIARRVDPYLRRLRFTDIRVRDAEPNQGMAPDLLSGRLGRLVRPHRPHERQHSS